MSEMVPTALDAIRDLPTRQGADSVIMSVMDLGADRSAPSTALLEAGELAQSA